MAKPEDDLARLRERGTVRDVGVIVQSYGEWGQWAEAERALEGILSRARPRDLIWLESNARSVLGSYQYYLQAWAGLEAEGVARLPSAAQRLATFHASGRVREAAVRTLAASSDADVLPYLLFRANDWVVQISDAARGALEARLRLDDAAASLALLPFEAHARGLGRRPLAALFDRVRQILAQPDAGATLREAFASGATETRRACADIAASLPAPAGASLLAVAIADRDPVVASVAVRGLIANVAGAELCDLLGELCSHSIAGVRADALIAFAARAPTEASGPLREGLFDAARRVREVAQFELRRRCAIEPLPLYVAALLDATGRKRRATVAGVGECGRLEDAPHVAPFLRDPSSHVRLEALRAVARLAPDAHASAFLDALEDPSARVARVALEVLHNRAHLVSRAQLEALRMGGGRAARHALRLLPRVSYWGALVASLESAAIPELTDVALHALERLLSPQARAAPPHDHDALTRALAAVRAQLPATMAARMDVLLTLTLPR